MAGWDKHEGGAVYAIPLGGTLIKVPFTIGELRVHTVRKSRHPHCWSEPAGLLIGVPSACTPQGIPVSSPCTTCAACQEFLHLLLASVHRNISLGCAGGSGSAYIMGLCDKLWRANMTEQECQAFVHKAVTHAMARDGSSGVFCLMLQIFLSQHYRQSDSIMSHTCRGLCEDGDHHRTGGKTYIHTQQSAATLSWRAQAASTDCCASLSFICQLEAK